MPTINPVEIIPGDVARVNGKGYMCCTYEFLAYLHRKPVPKDAVTYLYAPSLTAEGGIEYLYFREAEMDKWPVIEHTAPTKLALDKE